MRVDRLGLRNYERYLQEQRTRAQRVQHTPPRLLWAAIKVLPWISGCVKDVCDDARPVMDVQMCAISFKSGLDLATCAVADGAI